MAKQPRSRDGAGRPRNTRPRDSAGRPLTPGAPGVEPVAEGVVRTVEQALSEAQQLLDAGRAFGAHEVLEAMWKQAEDPSDRALWRGMAQLMVGLTHWQRGNLVGARSLLERGAQSLDDVDPARPAPLDVEAWRRWGLGAAADVAAGHDPAPPPRLS